MGPEGPQGERGEKGKGEAGQPGAQGEQVSDSMVLDLSLFFLFTLNKEKIRYYIQKILMNESSNAKTVHLVYLLTLNSRDFTASPNRVFRFQSNAGGRATRIEHIFDGHLNLTNFVCSIWWKKIVQFEFIYLVGFNRCVSFSLYSTRSALCTTLPSKIKKVPIIIRFKNLGVLIICCWTQLYLWYTLSYSINFTLGILNKHFSAVYIGHSISTRPILFN